ncbi:MAG: hypothetical protein EBR82_77000, partial [Caulobacteraceae bacterium]|nr:hypothetical protein [Caulobacteraceae bacterium]
MKTYLTATLTALLITSCQSPANVIAVRQLATEPSEEEQAAEQEQTEKTDAELKAHPTPCWHNLQSYQAITSAFTLIMQNETTHGDYGQALSFRRALQASNPKCYRYLQDSGL